MNNSEKASTSAPGATSAWEKVLSAAPQSPQSPESSQSSENLNQLTPAQDRYRQTCKLVAALAYGEPGQPNLHAIFAKHVNPPSDAWDRALDGLARHEFEHEEHAILESIAGPLRLNGAEHTMNNLSAKRERRILGYMTAGVSGFNGYDRLDSSALIDFAHVYPTPMDFEQASADFLDRIETYNGVKRRFEYEVTMNDFKHKVYGKKQEYWERMQELESFAHKRTAESSPHTSQPDALNPSEYSPHSPAPETSAIPKQLDALAQDAPEIASSYEWAPGAHAAFQVSKTQVRRGEAQPDRLHPKMLADNTCEDAFLVNESSQLYGVFDGAGGHGGGRDAAQAALHEVQIMGFDRADLQTGEELARMLDYANSAVYFDDSAGYSTAVLAKPCEYNGQKFLAYASVGDSRIYVVNKSGETKLVTKDEGEIRIIDGEERSVIWNFLGSPPPRGGGSIVKQFGRIPVESGDRVVLCSDGITGDFEPDLMSDEEIGAIVRSAMTPEDAALDLVGSARKTDDRTAIVFQI